MKLSFWWDEEMKRLNMRSSLYRAGFNWWQDRINWCSFFKLWFLFLQMFSVGSGSIFSTKDTQQAQQARVRLQLTPSPCFCSVTGSIRPSKHKSATTSNVFFLALSIDFSFFALIYPGNICQAHILSFINTLLHTYKVTHIHTWQLPNCSGGAAQWTNTSRLWLDWAAPPEQFGR